MAKPLATWLLEDVEPFQDKSVTWLSEHHFFRDPQRPTFVNLELFFSPADGVILYQGRVAPDEPLLSIKGMPYSVRDALRRPDFQADTLVIGIFMTFFDVHVNRIPYPGQLSFRELDSIDTYNHPMLDVEKHILDNLRVPNRTLDYLHYNQRMVNRIHSSFLDLEYYVIQIADYDVDCITPFDLKQHQPVQQGERFSMIRYGSQVDLIVPVSPRFDLELLQKATAHVEAGIDPLIRITPKPALLEASRHGG